MMVVWDQLQQLEIEVKHVELGYAEIRYPFSLDISKIKEVLPEVGFGLICDEEELLGEKIKVQVITSALS